MEDAIQVTPALNGYVRVSIEIGRETWNFTWKMTVAEATAEALKILRQAA